MNKVQIFIKRRVCIIVCIILYTLFHNTIKSFIINDIIPLFSSILNNNLLVQLALLLSVIIPYVVIDYQKEKIAWGRIVCVIVFLFIYLVDYRFSASIEFYGVANFALSYLDCCCIAVLVIEVFLIFKLPKSKELRESNAVAFIKEAPTTDDQLDRKDYIPVLLDKILSTFHSTKSESAFTILINEKYGFGKTSFLQIFQENAVQAGIDYINYRPWLSENSSGLTRSFFNMLGENITDQNPILRRLLTLYAKLIIEPVSTSIISYLDTLLDKPQKSLEAIREEIIIQLKGRPRPYVIAIDDVDRLCFDELITLLKLIRNTADFPNIYYIIAADHSVLLNTLERNDIQTPELYLKKFFNFELLFPANENSVQRLFSKKLSSLLNEYKVESLIVREAVDALFKIEHLVDYFDNPREVYRYINLLSFRLELLQRENLINDINFPDLLKITMIEYLDAKIYKILRDHDDYFLRCNHIASKLYLKESNAFRNKYVTERGKEIKSTIDTITSTKSNPPQHSNDESLDAINDIVDKCIPTTYDLVASLVLDLFDKNRNCSKNSICYSSEYFKYFSGKYRKSEITNSEAFAILELSQEEQFAQKLSLIYNERRGNSLRHKFEVFVESHENCDRVLMSKHLTTLFRCVEDYMRPGFQPVEYCQPMQRFKDYGLDSIAFRLYNPRSTKIHGKELNLLTEYFNSECDYLGMSLVLHSIMPYIEYRDHCAICDYIFRWREVLIDRFIKEVIIKNPFERSTTEVISVLRNFHEGCWNLKFKAYLETYPEPMEWIYRFFKYENDELKWDYVYYKNIVGDDSLSSFIFMCFDSFVPEEIADDISKHFIGIETKLDHKNISSSIFLSDALCWWKNKASSDEYL